jgi:hypothetical protein
MTRLLVREQDNFLHCFHTTVVEHSVYINLYSLLNIGRCRPIRPSPYGCFRSWLLGIFLASLSKFHRKIIKLRFSAVPPALSRAVSAIAKHLDFADFTVGP